MFVLRLRTVANQGQRVHENEERVHRANSNRVTACFNLVTLRRCRKQLPQVRLDFGVEDVAGRQRLDSGSVLVACRFAVRVRAVAQSDHPINVSVDGTNGISTGSGAEVVEDEFVLTGVKPFESGSRALEVRTVPLVDWINHGGRIVDLDYDPTTGYLNKVTDPLAQKTLLERDAAGRVSQVTLPEIGDPAETPFIGLGHDGIGNLTSVVPSGHDATNDHELDYTPVNLLERYTPPAASGTGTLFTEYEYNGDRQLTKIKRPDGVDVVFTYDSVKARITNVSAGTRQVTFGYDDLDKHQLVSLSGPDVDLSYEYSGHLLKSETWSNGVSGTVSRSYNNDFLLETELVNGGNSVTYVRDNDGLPTTVGAMTVGWHTEAPIMTSRTLGTVSETIVPDAFAETASTRATANGQNVLSITFDQRDNLGRITDRTESLEGETAVLHEYSYDPLGRLSQVWKDGVLQDTYTYDHKGNRTNNGAQYDDQDRLTEDANYEYAHTENGELETRTDKATLLETT